VVSELTVRVYDMEEGKGEWVYEVFTFKGEQLEELYALLGRAMQEQPAHVMVWSVWAMNGDIDPDKVSL
jgi:hypothetical protein